MYWCNRYHFKTLFISAVFASGLLSCKPDVHVTEAGKRYFDLKQFINADSARLNKLAPLVLKAVQHNSEKSQTLRVTIKNWGEELALFSASDINKPAWRDSYQILQQGDSVIYTALYPELVTRRMVISKNGEAVKKIVVDNFTKNLLYQTKEHLVYYPDSLYLIDKEQKVKLIGVNRYRIAGKIK
ncbi:hypothetical protein [Mucilaginibacter sp. CSA2-8R]|uniref:hypothetical protein n=1 Tax=Mucilaginibacter sp. CSA2-8R TaxID=3141542 RepID=UPI00315D037B